MKRVFLAAALAAALAAPAFAEPNEAVSDHEWGITNTLPDGSSAAAKGVNHGPGIGGSVPQVNDTGFGSLLNPFAAFLKDWTRMMNEYLGYAYD